MVAVKPIMEFVNSQKIKWFGHLVRMLANQPALRAYKPRLRQ